MLDQNMSWNISNRNATFNVLFSLYDIRELAFGFLERVLYRTHNLIYCFPFLFIVEWIAFYLMWIAFMFETLATKTIIENRWNLQDSIDKFSFLS